MMVKGARTVFALLWSDVGVLKWFVRILVADLYAAAPEKALGDRHVHIYSVCGRKPAFRDFEQFFMDALSRQARKLHGQHHRTPRSIFLCQFECLGKCALSVNGPAAEGVVARHFREDPNICVGQAKAARSILFAYVSQPLRERLQRTGKIADPGLNAHKIAHAIVIS